MSVPTTMPKKETREKSVEQIEKLFVLEALKRNAWNVTHSAEQTGMLARVGSREITLTLRPRP